jgi:hypothetical protein
MKQDFKSENELEKISIQRDKETKSSQLSMTRENEGLKIKDVDERIEAAKVEVLREAQIEINKQIQMSQASFITVFGIFASITSFLTIEFQFLKTLNNVLQILGFTLVLFSLLFGFNIALDYLVKSRFDKETPTPTFWFSFFVVGLLIVGIFFTLLGK